jgi:hypothetical protein
LVPFYRKVYSGGGSASPKTLTTKCDPYHGAKEAALFSLAIAASEDEMVYVPT